ncbi:MAG: hypothetical protein WBO37_10250 [Gammaproteobacteria bacterium]
MKTVNRLFDSTVNVLRKRQPKAGRGLQSRLTLLAMCSALLLPGIAMAKKPVVIPVGCVVFAPAYIDTGNPFTLKIVRDPAYPGVWSQPMVDVAAVFTGIDGGKITASYSETSSRYGYGVTYINATLLAPSCNGFPCAIDSSVDAVITVVVKEPLNKGKQFRETSCTPAAASVNPAM